MEHRLRIRERRKSTRVKVTARAYYTRFDNKGRVSELATSRSMDISSGGVRLKSSFWVDLREILQVTMAFRLRMLTFKAEVVHVTPSKNEDLEFGLRIKGIKDQDRIALTRFVIRKCREMGFRGRRPNS